MPNTIHTFDFLDRPTEAVPPVVVLFGNESFLKRLATRSLRRAIVGDDDAPFTTLDGAVAQCICVSNRYFMVDLSVLGDRCALDYVGRRRLSDA